MKTSHPVPSAELQIAPAERGSAEDVCAVPYENVQPVFEPAIPDRPSPGPDAWPASLRRDLEKVSFLCKPAYSSTLRGQNVVPDLGCEYCPKGTLESEPHEDSTERGAAVRSPVARPTESLKLFLKSIHQGSFTRLGAREMVIEFHGCEPRAAGGGSYLLQPSGSGWKVRGYARGAVGCSVTKLGSGRLVQVCSRSHTSGTSIAWWTHVVDWKPLLKSGPPGDEPLMDFSSESPLSRALCQLAGGPALIGELGAPELVDVNGDGVHDVRLQLSHAEISNDQVTKLDASPDFRLACNCDQYEFVRHGPLKPGCRCPSLTPPQVSVASLVFVAQGDKFLPSPETQTLMLRLHSVAGFVEGQCSACTDLAQARRSTP